MKPQGVCIQVDHSSFGTTKGSGLRINDVVIAHGMLLAPFCCDKKDPITRLSTILKDIQHDISCTCSRDVVSIPIKFKVLSKNSSHSFTNKTGVIHERCNPTYCTECVDEATVRSLYIYSGLSDITNEISNWTGCDSSDNCLDRKLLDYMLPVFIIMTVNKPSQSIPFKKHLHAEYSAIKDIDIYPGLPLVIESTPFGNFSLANSWCQGIVSKIIGSESNGILTDARLVSGCEGAPIYSFQDGVKGPLVGLVIQALLWRSGEAVGFSLGLSAKHILSGILGLQTVADYIPFNRLKQEISNVKMNMDDLSAAVVLVRCLNKWGSGVVIDTASGLVLTCSHIVYHAQDSVQILCGDDLVPARVVYVSPPSSTNDLALVSLGRVKGLKQLELADTPPVLGEKVLMVGYPRVVSADRTPTLTAGCVAKVSWRGGPVQTTCSTLSGASGGALLRPPLQLLGIVTSNAQLVGGGIISSLGFAVSVEDFRIPIQKYIDSKDPSCLQSLSVDNYAAKMEWAFADCKL